MGRPRKSKAVEAGKSAVQPAKKPGAARRAPTAVPPASDGSENDDDLPQSSSSAKPPSKRKMPPAGVKKARPTTANAKRMPARSAKKDPWGEEKLTTSSKSRIIDIDLIKLLAKPEAWTCLDEDEKKQILALLPENIHPNAEPADPEGENYAIPPLPESFVRYSNSWRDGVRGYQQDLQNGKYDPEWQRQAAVAMEERARGRFDKFKEDQYEEFWGQKQKLDHYVIAGDSSKVKLEELIKHGVVRVGDVWKYSRSFGKKSEKKTLVEKEVKVIESNGSSLTFAIPPGRRVFSSNGLQPTVSQHPKQASNNSANYAEGSVSSRMSGDSVPASSANETPLPTDLSQGEIPASSNDPLNALRSPTPTIMTNGHKPENAAKDAPPSGLAPSVPESSITPSEPVEMEIDSEETSTNYPTTTTTTTKPVPIRISRFTDIIDSSDSDSEELTEPPTDDDEPPPFEQTPQKPPVPKPISAAAKTLTEQPEAELKTETEPKPEEQPRTEPDVESPNPSSSSPPKKEEPSQTNKPQLQQDIIFRGVTGPGGLGRKILAIDGRITDPPHGNSWKEFRCFRNNQDIGSLWEVRQALFLKGK
ncbi:hypothetical protein AJ80_04903 [Polytolypa hystricis UAMH7299]|uniref:DEUBAD domain-containing protein n=1 Tax=Polytolypa hystricis (strain UAMH7299) TaxID=1447883 RepID=A0A2B7Y877_POLH7|nr:hypothetical protein AJ80_04903 [Polytolypa hystricis UAMH7299]